MEATIRNLLDDLDKLRSRVEAAVHDPKCAVGVNTRLHYAHQRLGEAQGELVSALQIEEAVAR